MFRQVRSALLGMFVVLGALLPATPALAQTDPATAARFAIVIDGVEIAMFNELVEIRSGNDDVLEIGAGRLLLPRSRLLPVAALRRGQSSSMEMWSWHEAARNNPSAARKSATLVMYDTAGAPVARFHLENAWPAKLVVGTVKAGSSSIVIETVTLVCDSIQRIGI